MVTNAHVKRVRKEPEDSTIPLRFTVVPEVKISSAGSRGEAGMDGCIVSTRDSSRAAFFGADGLWTWDGIS